MVINGGCSTNMCARQLSFNFSSMVWGAWPRGPPLDPPLQLKAYIRLLIKTIVRPVLRIKS